MTFIILLCNRRINDLILITKLMKRKIIFIVCLAYLTIISSTVSGQSGFTLSIPVIYSKVELLNNWSPSTAINRQNQFDGTSIGTAINLNYSLHPTLLIKDKNILMNIGVGYFNQRFYVRRPFDYNSPLQPIFYTDNYVYHGFQGILGLSYRYTLGKKYFLLANLSYSWMRSFRQDYTPTSNYGYGELTQINRNQIDFGNMLLLAVGLNRNMGDKFALRLNVLAPIYTRWRNDKIFKDDTSTFSHPKLSLGISIAVAYNLKSKVQP